MKLTDYITGIGRPVAYYPNLKKITGSTTATILLCQFLYWRGKEYDANGWLYKTSEEIESETGLSYNEQKTARAALKEAGLLEEHYARLDHQMKFRVNLDAVNDKWGTLQPIIPESGNPSLGKDGIHYSLNESENTSENTYIEPAEDIFLQASKKVDYIIEANEKAKSRSWSNLPANYHDYGRAFFEVTGLKYVKSMAFDCMSTFDEWRESGFSPDNVREAFAELKAAGKQGMVSRPGSLTWKLRSLAVENNTKEVFPCYED